MADVNANIGINIDSSAALAELKSLQRQISQFHSSIAKTSVTAAQAQASLQKNLLSSVNAIGAFSASMVQVKTSSQAFTDALEKNKFSMREYFRYAGASTKTFGKLFKTEYDTIGRVAEERVKKLQTQYIKMGQSVNGVVQAMAITPRELDMSNFATQTALAAQKQQLFNQLLRQGSTNLLNFGKNTQWAGRQLMVGFTLPLMAFGSAASKAFMDMETQALKFRKVYGDLFTTPAETNDALAGVKELANSFTQYGVAASQTVALAADAAAAGFQGLDLQAQTREATRLSVLGQIDQQQALETTIALQNAFNISAQDLAANIDFLNAVENQTVTSLDDITIAIPKVAPVIKQLGGDVKDLAFFLTAMKEGGVNASEGANALKSGLAALINPTNKAKEMLQGMGIDIVSIVEKDKGNLKKTVVDFAKALDTLSPLTRARAIEQMFGKFQFARLSTLFQNVTKDGTQASRVLDLATASAEDLASVSQKELGMTADSAMVKFRKTIEDLKITLIPIGKAFLEAVTPIVKFVGDFLDKFNNLGDGTKKTVALILGVVGGLGPVLLMTFGLLANGIANVIKLFLTLRGGYMRLTGESKILGEQTQYMTSEQIDAAAAAHSLDQIHAKLTQQFTAEAEAVYALRNAYAAADRAARTFAATNPGMMLPGKRKKFASGGVVPGSGNGDTVPAMLTPGEVVVPKDIAKQNMGLLASLFSGKVARRYAEGSLNVGGRALSMQFLNARQLGPIQNIINQVISGAAGLRDAEGVVAETLMRLSADTKISTKKFVRELDIVASEMEQVQIPEKIVGERDYSASGAGVAQNVKTQLAATRGVAGEEEYRRAQVAAQATQKAYEEMGISGQQLAQSIQVDRAHVVEVTQAEKRYREAWDTRLFVAQARAENEMSMLLINEKNQKAYTAALQRTGASEEMKRSILNKITKDIALTEDELQVQVKVLEQMQRDTALMAQTTPNFQRVAVGTIAAGKARAAMGPASYGVGSRNAAEIEMARQTLIRSKFRGDLNFIKKIKSQGVAAIEELMVAMERKAETRSDSKRTYRLGKNIIGGLMTALKGGEAQLNAQAQKIADIATLSKTSLYGTTGTIDPVQKSIRRQLDKRIKLSEVQAGMAINPGLIGTVAGNAPKPGIMGRIRGINPMKAGMGLMGVGMAASMLPGTAGTVGGMVGTGAFIAQSLMMLPGPLKLVAGGLAATYGFIKTANYFREKEIQAIQGVGKAANMSSAQIEKLSGILGFTPLKSNLELSKPQVSGLTPEKSKQVEEVRKLLGDDKEFKNQVKALQNATKQEAELIIKSSAMRLLGQGASKEAVTNFVYALQQEAGRLDVALDFKTIDITTKEGRAAIQKSADTLVSDFTTAYQKGWKSKFVQANDGTVFDVGTGTDELKKKAATTANVLANMFQSLDTQLRSGIINAEQYSQTFDGLAASINKLKKPEGLYLTNEILKTLPSETAKAATAIGNVADKLLILNAAALGVYVTQKMIDTLAGTSQEGGAQRARNRVRNQLRKDIKDATQIAQELAKILGGGTGTGTEKALTNKEKYDKAYAIIKNFFDAQEALVRRERKAGADLLQAKVDNAQKAVDAAQKEIDAKQQLIDANNHEIDLINRKIELNYNRPIEKLQDESTILNNNLEIIRHQEDAINSQYDQQIKALETISSLNQDVANREQARLNIASALTSGDIAAAAQAAQDARAQAAQSAIDNQRNAIEASRQQALAGVSAGGMTKDQIEQRTYQIGQQIFTLEQQRKTLQDQITAIQDKNWIIEQQIYSVKVNSLIPSQKILDDANNTLKAYNEQTDKIVASITYLKQTADEWETNRIKVEAANSQLTLTKGILKDAQKAAESIFAAWDKIKDKVITITTNYVSNYISSGKKMYGGKIIGMAAGGIVGGSGYGDKVPTMLTPGEFVVNKTSAQAFGPLLNSINESLYPSMLTSKAPVPAMSSMSNVADNSSTLYNYNLGFNINGSNVNAKELAGAVITEIKRLDAQKIRKQR